jgi:hypothetical protein
MPPARSVARLSVRLLVGLLENAVKDALALRLREDLRPLRFAPPSRAPIAIKKAIEGFAGALLTITQIVQPRGRKLQLHGERVGKGDSDYMLPLFRLKPERSPRWARELRCS